MVVLEIRTYRLKPGTRDEFVRVMQDEARPLLERFGIRVAGAGPSIVDEDGHEEAYLIRVFASLAERDEQEGRFYGSPEWRDGPRGAIVSRIDTYHTIVIEAPDSLIDAYIPR